jgi:predicted TIM-barrel fold metal-dependent hydrolase
MELNGWLPKYADPSIREKIRPLYLGGAGAHAEQSIKDAEERRKNPEAARALEANLMNAKGWSALGAFDSSERVRALDLMGVAKQLVFSTFAPTQFASDDLDLLYGGTRAHNRAMADFCAADQRMIAVGFVPLIDAERALIEAREAIKLGCGAILVPSAPPRDKSPTHPDFHPLWALLQETGVPFVTHVGGGGRSLRPAFHKNGKPPTTDILGGGENIRSKDYMSLHFSPEIFVACMVLDGIFEQFPGLRGGCIEQGAMWVIPLLKRLDLAQDAFQKTEPALRLKMKASDYVRRQVKFTPFATEPTGWLIDQGGENLFLFSTDYPHPEGTRDPLDRFERSLSGTSEAAKERFYSGNFAEMMGISA